MSQIRTIAAVATLFALTGPMASSIAAPITPAPQSHVIQPALAILKVHSRSSRHCHKRLCRWVTRRSSGSHGGSTRRVRVCGRVCHRR